MSDPLLAAKSRKGKEREAPQQDLFDKLIQIQRSKAAQAGSVLVFFHRRGRSV